MFSLKGMEFHNNNAAKSNENSLHIVWVQVTSKTDSEGNQLLFSRSYSLSCKIKIQILTRNISNDLSLHISTHNDSN